MNIALCPRCNHPLHHQPCQRRVGGVPGFPSTQKPCGCPGDEVAS